jgi:shikimate kinase
MSTIADKLCLVGYPGAGKSTVAKALGERAGWAVVNMDDFIEAKINRTISQIFKADGERHFRTLENFALRELLGRRRVIISTGGGTFVQDKNHALMLRQSTVVYLHVELAEAIERCKKDGDTRPLMRKPVERAALYTQRSPIYEKAPIRIDTTGRSVEEVVEAVLRKVPQFSQFIT